MATYVSLMRWTAQGVESLDEAPQRTKEAIESLEKMGGKLLGFYYLMGEYDMVGIGGAPSDEVAMAFLAGLNAQGSVRSTTMRAFTAEEAQKIMEKLAP